MITLPGGDFRTGDAFGEGHPEDAEGPARPVTVGPLLMDATAVTNARFTDFVRATGYRTEAERYGDSFVCHAPYCHGHRVGARSRNTPDSSTGHGGFRCAWDLAER